MSAFTLTSAVIYMGGIAGAADLDGIWNFRALVSDNVDRLPPGLETSGTIFELTAGLSLEEERGSTTYILSGEVGRERTNGTVREDELIYRLGGDVTWSFKQQRFIQIIAGATRETATLDPGDLNRQRALEERTNVRVLTGGVLRSGTEWQGAVASDQFEREDLNVKSNWITANAAIPINSSTDLLLDSMARTGTREQVFVDEWIEGFIDMEYRKRRKPNLTIGSSLYWYSSDTDSLQSNLTIKWDNFHLTGFQDILFTPSTPLHLEIGIDGIRSSDLNWDMDLYADVSLTSTLSHDVTPLGKRAEIKAQVTYRGEVNRQNVMVTSIGRRETFEIVFVWRTRRYFEIDTTFLFANDFFPDNPFLPDRDETEILASVGSRWRISDQVNLRVAAIMEQIDSELNTRDLGEKRLEMNLNGNF